MRFWLQRLALELGHFGAGAEGQALGWRASRSPCYCPVSPVSAYRREAGAGCGNIVLPRPGAGRWRARTCSCFRSDSEVDMAQVVP
jgi:hypothetical protein